MKIKFTKFDDLPEGKKEYRKIATALAVQMTEPFEVDTLEACNQQGKAGDYLIKGIAGELYPCDQSIFNETYVENNITSELTDKDKLDNLKKAIDNLNNVKIPMNIIRAYLIPLREYLVEFHIEELKKVCKHIFTNITENSKGHNVQCTLCGLTAREILNVE